MRSYRIFVEKKPGFRVEAQALREELNENLLLHLKKLRLLNVYDLFDFTPELVERSRYRVFGEVVTDKVTVAEGETALGLKALGLPEGSKASWVAYEFLPGQFDQRAASAEDCVRLLDPAARIRIRSARLILLEEGVDAATLAKIRHYCINAVEAREKDLSVLAEPALAQAAPVPVLEGFRTLADPDAFCRERGLAMNGDDLRCVIEWFRGEGRDPNETELRILDTYWSDHCRHTTFNTVLDEMDVEESFIKEDIEEALSLYRHARRDLGREDRPVCLMDLATVGARYLRAKGFLDDLEVSEENNACSVYVDVDVDGKTERWLLMFKNETHNHPTEIEPFGGAATCLGGAIRDPLSGRSYVYQAMRVTGAGNLWTPVVDTMPGKLPQRVISRKAAQGYSSYGNQIGLATTHVHECIHPDYVAKRLEIGAVVGAVRADSVRRESPCPGDIILMLGGRTGRDGIGGATGSSKEHTTHSLETCGSEVQKGNPPEERKLQRLFRRREVTRLIKKANDFGAGGVSVAIGELAPGLDIWLDRVPVKYSGLNVTEIAISESQERMAVVVAAGDEAAFRAYCAEENLSVTHVATVTDTERMRLYYDGRLVADLGRAFIDSAGASRHARAVVPAVAQKDPFAPVEMDGIRVGKDLSSRLAELLSRPGVCSQKGLVEQFDATIGRSTVLMPYGGLLQQTPTQVSVQKLPTDGYTDTASLMAFGFDPFLSSWSPYHGAAYAMVEACAKAVAAGADFRRMRFSFQEYFRRMSGDPKTWGLPLAALLGALKMQIELGLPSIGGKDSMSGTFGDRHVPPTLVAFGVTTLSAATVISPEFKRDGNRIYLVRHTPEDNRMPDVHQLKENWDYVHRAILDGTVVSAYATGRGGVAEALCKMAFGNAFGVDVQVEEEELWGVAPGSLVVESRKALDLPSAVCLGKVTSGEDGLLHINGESAEIFAMMEAWEGRFAQIYPVVTPSTPVSFPRLSHRPVTVARWPGKPVARPVAYLPVFPGTNCDYDTAKAFRTAGAEVRLGVFCNRDEEDILRSVARMRDAIDQAHILAFCGGFSAGDEPDGSGKFIANILAQEEIAAAIRRFRERGGLILGICNGFQALVKSGLLPYGELGSVTADSPTLFRNDINRHVSRMVTTRVVSVASPWLAGMKPGEEHTIPVSHGEGKFVVSDALARKLFAAGQVAFQYADPLDGRPTMEAPDNPNGSCYAIEGILSPDGRILGKMGHSERYENNLFKNIEGNLDQPLFRNAVRYFQGK